MGLLAVLVLDQLTNATSPESRACNGAGSLFLQCEILFYPWIIDESRVVIDVLDAEFADQKFFHGLIILSEESLLHWQFSIDALIQPLRRLD